MARFRSGESGNPGGRPAGHGEIREIARKHTDAAIETLVTVMNDSDATPSARVGAATALLDRGWGRPAQTIKANIDGADSMADLLGPFDLTLDARRMLDYLGKSSEQVGISDCAIAGRG
jgi:hypothetical protein